MDMSTPSASSLLLLLPIIIITVLTSSVLVHPIQEAQAQKSAADTTGWAGSWGDLSGAPPANASASSYFLIVKWIECYEPEDFNTDETVVKAFGNEYRQWGPNSMSRGETEVINMETAFDAAHHDITIEVWDYDRGDIFDRHDFIDSQRVPAVVTHGNVQLSFFEPGGDPNAASYGVVIEVVQRH